MKENEILENQQTRDELVERTEVLDKVKELILLPNTEFATTEQVATYFNTTKDNIKQTKKRNNDELISDGVKNSSYKEIKQLINSDNTLSLLIPPKGTLLFPKRAILRMAMLLRDSEVANNIKKELGLPTNANISIRNEIKFKKILDKIILNVKNELIKNIGASPHTELYKDIVMAINNLCTYNCQYFVCNNKYRIDFYFNKINIAIEYDEDYHNSDFQIKKDKQREYEIKRYVYINKYYKEITKEELKEWNIENLEELFDVEFEENNLEYSFDLTRFIRVKENDMINGVINVTTILTKAISDIIYSRGMSCDYKDLIG